MNKIKFLLLLSVTTVLFSCDKEDLPFIASASAPNTVAPSYPENHDQFNFVNTVTIVRVPGTGAATEAKFYTATAFSLDGKDGFNDMGEVKVEGKKLAIQSNNSYVYSDLSNPLTPDGPVDWSVGGSTYTTAKSIPSLKSLDEPGDINLSDATLNIESRNCDKILVVLSNGADKAVVKTFDGDAKIVSFTQSELSKLTSTTAGFIQVTPYNYEVVKVNDRDAVLGNQTTYNFTGITFK